MKSLLLAVAFALSLPALAADTAPTPNRYAASIVPAERFDIGGVLVERHGAKAAPLILIPGLSSGAWAWQDTIRQFEGQHAIYVLTLPGFDAQPAIAGNVADITLKAIEQLIATRKLKKPVLIGHSLGGTLSLAYAERHPAQIGGVVTIDGLPVFPGTETMPLDQRPQMAEGMKARMAGMDRATFAAQQKSFMRGTGVLDMSRADALAELSAKSDPAAVVGSMADIFALDLRPDLAKIDVPVLVIAPYFDADATQTGATEASKAEYYKSLMAGTPKVEVKSIAPARHFLMFDQPEKLADTIRSYLKSL